MIGIYILQYKLDFACHDRIGSTEKLKKERLDRLTLPDILSVLQAPSPDEVIVCASQQKANVKYELD